MQDTNSFTTQEATEFLAHLDPAPLPRPVTHQDVVRALNQQIAILEADLEKERAKNDRPDTVPFYAMVNTLDMHRALLMAAQGDSAAQVQVITLMTAALWSYATTLEAQS